LSRVKVTINKRGNIPSLGPGPIRRPILITEELYQHLVALGYPVTVINPPIKPVIKNAPVTKHDDEVTETVAEVQIEPAVEAVAEAVTEEVVEDTVMEEEEITESEEVVEIVENDPDLSAGSFYTEDFLTSKALCKKILASREVQYDSNASWALLKQLVLDSNPVVE